MDFGMPTLIETHSLDECVELCKSLHLNFIELNMNLPQYQIDMLDIKKIQRYIESDGIYFTIHLDENLNVCDFNKLVADAFTNTILSVIELSKKLDIQVLNMHMSNGVYFTLPEKRVYLFDQYKDIYMDKIKWFREKCEQAIGTSDIKICIENCDGYPEFAMQAIEYLIESDIFGLTFDIGHSHSAGNIDETFILGHSDKLYHMHIHDAKGNKNHLELGAGDINIAEKLLLAKERNCRCVLETKTIDGLSKSVQALKQYT